MRKLSTEVLTLVGGGGLSCREATIRLLESCDFSTLKRVNAIFKGVVHSDEMQGADDETIRKALINAVYQNYF